MVNVADKIRKFLRALPKNSETKNTGFHKEIPKEIYMSLEERQKAIDYLRLIQCYNNKISKNKNAVR